jgi:hypothetical protein
VIKLGKKTIKDVPAAVIFVLVLAATLLTDLSPVLFVLASALCGIVIENVRARG